MVDKSLCFALHASDQLEYKYLIRIHVKPAKELNLKLLFLFENSWSVTRRKLFYLTFKIKNVIS